MKGYREKKAILSHISVLKSLFSPFTSLKAIISVNNFSSCQGWYKPTQMCVYDPAFFFLPGSSILDTSFYTLPFSLNHKS